MLTEENAPNLQVTHNNADIMLASYVLAMVLMQFLHVYIDDTDVFGFPINPIEAQQLRVMVFPSFIVSGSSDPSSVNVSCVAVNGQPLYNAEYQFYLNEIPISAPTNSSDAVISITTNSNFTCNATQYTDLRIPIPSQLSPPVQAVVLGE